MYFQRRYDIIAEELPNTSSMSRDIAVDMVRDLLMNRNLATQQRDYFEIISHRREIFDKLLIIVHHFEPPPYHPIARAAASACQALGHLVAGPHPWFPELSNICFSGDKVQSPPGTPANDAEFQAELRASSKLMKLFLQQKHWKDALLRRWNRLENEKLEDLIGWVFIL